MSASIIKDLGEHPEDKKPVRIMKGQYGPYIKYKSLNATIPEEKDPLELNMEEALILIEKRKEYDINDAIKKSDLIIIHTEWNDFKNINFKKELKNKKFSIFDMRNIYSVSKMKDQKIKYFSIGN